MPIDIHQDLHDARTLLEQAGSEEEKRKYRKAAEIILLKAVHQEPDNQEAKILLQSARAVPVGFSSRVSEAIKSFEPSRAPEPVKAFEAVKAPEPLQEADPFKPFEAFPTHEPMNTHEPQKWQDVLKTSEPVKAPTPEMREEDVPFVAAPVFKSIDSGKKKKSGLKVPVGLIAVVVIGGGGLWMLQSRPANKHTFAAPASKTPSASSILPPATADQAHPSPASVQPVAETKGPVATTPANTTPAPVATPTVSTPPPPAPAATPAMGNLAVSSATVAEIYQSGHYLGATPTTLQLPVGRQTLEYRHGDLRTVVTHDIKNNQTVTASVTFQQTVQINSKPWAQVFIEGAPRRSLGQTPLSGVTVPIGSVLVFENPNFPSKTYRITDKDAAIQVDFP
jgi:hypothetical protein